MNPAKLTDESELDAWYEEQKRLLLEELEGSIHSKKEGFDEAYKRKLTGLMEKHQLLREAMIEKQLIAQVTKLRGKHEK